MTLSLIFLFLALALLVVSNIWMIVAGFRVSILWGLLNLFLSPAQLIFLFVHWEEARKPFFCSLVGLLVLIPAVVLNLDQITSPDGLLAKTVMAEVQKQMEAEAAAKGALSPAAVLAQKQAALLEHANEMNAKYLDLMARQKLLGTSDEATKAAFQADAEAYAALRKQVETEKAEVEALQAAAPK